MTMKPVINAGSAGEFVDDDDGGGAAALVAAHAALMAGVHGMVARGILRSDGTWIAKDAGFAAGPVHVGTGSYTVKLTVANPEVYLMCFAYASPRVCFQSGPVVVDTIPISAYSVSSADGPGFGAVADTDMILFAVSMA